MARKSSIEKNKNRANKVAMHANKRSRLKAIVNNRELPIEERFRAGLKLNEMPRNGAKSDYATDVKCRDAQGDTIGNLKCLV